MYKICSRCKEEKLVGAFSKKSRNKDGLKSHCKICDKDHYDANKSTILEQKRLHYIENQEQIVLEKRRYRKENSLKIKEKDKLRYIKNRARILKYKKAYGLKNKNIRRKYNISYCIKNKHILLALNAKRRASKLNATPKWLTKIDFEDIQEFYIAARMFKLYTGQEYHVDHIVPLQGENVCGLHVPWNLQVLTATENLSKSNKLLE